MKTESGLRVPDWYFQYLRNMNVKQYALDHIWSDDNLSANQLRYQIAIALKLMEFPDFAAHKVSISDKSIVFHVVTTDDNIQTIDTLPIGDDLTDYIKDGLNVKGIGCRLYQTPSDRDGYPDLRSRDAIVDDMLRHSQGRPVPATIGHQYLLSLTHDTDEALVSLFQKLEERISNETEEDS